MIKKMKPVNYLTGIALVILFCGTLLAVPADAIAKQKIVAIEGANYNVSASLADNLKSFVGKKISLTLDSGKSFVGFVKEVGNHLVHLEKLDGKEYFDALIRIESISGIDARFRQIQR
jgi:hypothetical protein